jgi:NaMN:DMB phosphoribosyltransferase
MSVDLTSRIATKIDNDLIKSVQAKLDNLTKPVGSLGVLVQAMNCYHQMATFSSAGVANRDA